MTNNFKINDGMCTLQKKMPSTSSPPQKKVAKAIVPYSTNQIAYFLSQEALKQMKNDCIIKFGVMRRIQQEQNET